MNDRALAAPADLTLAAWFAGRARSTPERPAITFEGVTQTYGQLEDRTRRLAAALQSSGVGPGDRVAFLGHNQPQILEGLFAAAALGATYVPLNFRCTGPELAYMIDHARVRVLLVDGVHRPLVDGLRSGLGTVERYVAVDGAGEGWESWEDLVAAHEPLAELAPTRPEDCAAIMYTSGTTGRPKGAMLSHASMWWNNVNFITTMDLGYDDVSLVVAPLFHIGALNCLTLATWIKGGHLVVQRAFEPGAALAAVAEHRVTTMFGVPAMFQFMAAHPTFADTDLRTLRSCLCGGAPLPEGLIRTYLARGIDFAQGYGLTEASPMLCFLTPEYALSKLGSTGRPPMFVEICLKDVEGRTVTEPDTVGEICARGPVVMLGYLDDPGATAKAIDADGWLHTGDGGHRDADGFYYVSDRIKDMVISGGENIYPAEIESVLYDHPAIVEVAVIGVPDEQWGEAVCAVVALAPGAEAPTLEDVRAYTGARLARYKLPKRLEVLDALPRNPTGKVLKVELRSRFH
ncbi:MAG: O-succinylbenzoic acid--CoA ligase [Frankiales bacterium]|nr:O-succinylbenzoic acid--CoA ligase [Frankiales bacterium]